MTENKPTMRPKLSRDIDGYASIVHNALLKIAADQYEDKNELWDLLRKVRCAGHSINQLAQKAITEIGEV
jgi:hypothetical protein